MNRKLIRDMCYKGQKSLKDNKLSAIEKNNIAYDCLQKILEETNHRDKQ